MCGERRIYLASPYSNPDPALRKARHEACRAVTAKLLEKGHCVFSPITNAVPLAAKAGRLWGFVHWKEYDLSFLRHWATELWVLCLDGWDASEGVLAEIKAAQELGLHVYFLEAADV